jgi:hypothetical protein
MIKRSTLTFFVAVVALNTGSQALAQTQDAFGPVLPMTFDGQGGRHFCTYGYYGPSAPPISSPNNKIAVCCDYLTVVSGRPRPTQECPPGVRR